jgi:PAS domain S-box-containing protein
MLSRRDMDNSEFVSRTSIKGDTGIAGDIAGQQELPESEEGYRLIVENASQGIVIAQENAIRYANPKITEYSGYTREELTSRPFLDLIYADDREMVINHHRDVLLEKAPLRQLRHRIINKQGRIKWIEVTGVPFTWEAKPSTLLFISDITEQKEIEDRLRESEERYRDLIENTGDLIYVMDGNGNFKLVNQTIEREYGYSASDLLGKGFTDIITPESYKLAADVFQRQLEGIDVGSREYDLYDKDGNINTIETKEQLVWEGDRVIEVYGIARDVTDRKRIEAALRESEEKYRLVVENANEMITVSVEGNLSYVNKKALEISGFSEDELIGVPVIDLIHPDDRHLLVDHREKRNRGNLASKPLIMRLIIKSGDIVWSENSIVPITWQGKPAALNITTDITERKRIEDSLRESEEKYRLLVENASEGIAIGQDGITRFANPIITKLIGYSLEEITSRPFIEFLHPDDRQMALDHHLKRTSFREKPDVYLFRAISKSGDVIWFENNGVLITWEGRPATLNFLRDITEQRKIEDALRESEEKYRVVVENANEIVIISQNGIIKFANNRIKDLFGCCAKDVLSRHLSGLVIKEDRKRLREEYQRLISARESFPSYRYRTTDIQGNSHIIEVSGIHITWEEQPAILSFVTDVTDRVAAEKALQESEAFTRGLVENAPLGILYLDKEGTITYENPMSWMITAGGFDETRPSRAIGMSVYDLPGIRDYPDSKDIIDTILGGGIITNYTLPFTSLTGKQTILNVYGAPRMSSDGVQIGSVILISDITEKVRSEEEIKRRLRHEKAVAFCSRELVSFSDLDETLQKIVEQLQEIVGFGCVFICKNFMDPVEGLCMKTVNEARAENRRPPFESPQPIPYKYLSRKLLDTMNAGRWYGGPTKDHPPTERKILDILGCLSSIRMPIFAGGRFWGLIGFDEYETERTWDEQDILLLQTISSMLGAAVARNEAQTALAESEKRYRELVDSTNDIIYVSDYRGNFKFINNAVRQLGYEPHEVIGRNIYEFYAPWSKKYAQELFRLQKSGAQFRGYELDIIRKDGQARTIEFRDELIWEGNRIVEVRGIVRDVTDRKKREDRLRLMAGSQEAVLNSLPEMVFFADMALKITWANLAASRLTDFPIEELVGRFCYEVLHQRNAPCEGCPALISLTTGRSEKKNSMPCLGKNRRVTAYPVPDISGSITGIAVSIGGVRSRRSLDISESFSHIDDEIEQDAASELFLAPLDPNYIYPFSLLIGIEKDTFTVTLRWDEYSKEHLLNRLTRSESAVARLVYLAARMKTDGTGWVDKEVIRAGTMDTNLNKLRSLLEESNIPFLDRFSSRMLIRSNKEEKKKVRLAISASNIEISPNIKDFKSKKHRYMAAITKKIKAIERDMGKASQPREYLVSELSIQRQNETNLKKSIDVVETLIRESAALLRF